MQYEITCLRSQKVQMWAPYSHQEQDGLSKPVIHLSNESKN